MFATAEQLHRPFALEVDLRTIPRDSVKPTGLFEQETPYAGPLRGNSYGEFLVPYGEGSVTPNVDVLSFGGGSLGEVR